eukprot:1159861-Pelagomonas_calceolata.AAC.8
MLDHCPKDGWWIGLRPVKKLLRAKVYGFEKADMENVMALQGVTRGCKGKEPRSTRSTASLLIIANEIIASERKKNLEPQGAGKERQKERQARPTRRGKGEGAR